MRRLLLLVMGLAESADRAFFLTAATALLGLGCGSAPSESVGSAPPQPEVPGYEISPRDLATPLASQADTAGPFRVLIDRRAPTASAERLLQVAEATYPPHHAVLAASDRRLSRADSAAVDLWWSTTFDGVRQPYAITNAAVRYYSALTEAYRRGEARQAGSIPMRSNSLTYRATIERRPQFQLEGKTFRDVYVASLSLSWHSYCGPLCAQAVSKQRVVVLTPSGRLVAVSGDGAPNIAAS
jgi:hypothetical protein